MPSQKESTVDVIIGLQHGDEGKGRFTDELAPNYDWVGRFNGGANAGHTIITNGHEIALHQVPSGVNHKGVKLYIGAHCVVNAEKLLLEISELEKAGLDVRNRLRISSQASIVQPGHILRDRRTMKGIGTTGNGIGPAYADQASRLSGDRQLDIRMGDLLDDKKWALQQVRKNLEAELELHESHNINIETCMEIFARSCDAVLPMIEQDPELLIKALRNDHVRILLEGAQGYGLDKTSGMTPDVTSSNTGVTAAFQSTGIPTEYKGTAYGVAKLIPSRVGHGEFISEFGRPKSEPYCMAEGGNRYTKEYEKKYYGNHLEDLLGSRNQWEMGVALRMLGGEYGATTKRPRRLGSLDLPSLRYAINMNGIDGLFLTKGDMLKDFARTYDGGIPITLNHIAHGQFLDAMPTTKHAAKKAEPVIRIYEPFTEDISSARRGENLPEEFKYLLRDIQGKLQTLILAVGVGPDREQVVHVNNLALY